MGLESVTTVTEAVLFIVRCGVNLWNSCKLRVINAKEAYTRWQGTYLIWAKGARFLRSASATSFLLFFPSFKFWCPQIFIPVLPFRVFSCLQNFSCQD